MKSYSINEVFTSLQGEGVRAGTANVFVRFAGCNLQCNGEEVGGVFQPICDTNFSGGRALQLGQLIDEIEQIGGKCRNVILTGGEPALQVDAALVEALKERGWHIAIETNGTRELPAGIHWICVSPKTAEHTMRVKVASEVKYVLHAGQALPKPSIDARFYVISPAFQPDGSLLRADLEWCVQLVKENPKWRLSTQQHKVWRVR
ncbi:MAG: 7-carboxy-7-deazaguanine synthase QueE [Blastocatellales bacterium]